MNTHAPTTIARRFPLGLATMALACLLLGSCGPNICKCLEEAEKENPNQEVMDKCRETFSKMDMDEVQAAVEKCK